MTPTTLSRQLSAWFSSPVSSSLLNPCSHFHPNLFNPQSHSPPGLFNPHSHHPPRLFNPHSHQPPGLFNPHSKAPWCYKPNKLKHWVTVEVSKRPGNPSYKHNMTSHTVTCNFTHRESGKANLMIQLPLKSQQHWISKWVNLHMARWEWSHSKYRASSLGVARRAPSIPLSGA